MIVGTRAQQEESASDSITSVNIQSLDACPRTCHVLLTVFKYVVHASPAESLLRIRRTRQLTFLERHISYVCVQVEVRVKSSMSNVVHHMHHHHAHGTCVTARAHSPA